MNIVYKQLITMDRDMCIRQIDNNCFMYVFNNAQQC